MNNQATVQAFQELRLPGMKNAFSAYLETSATLTPDELVAHLTQAEIEHRQQLRVRRLTEAAQFHYRAALPEIDFAAQRGLDKNLLLRLAQGTFIRQHENLLLTGPTGVGKSFIASAIGHQACLLGYKTLYFNTRKLFHLLTAALADNSYLKILEKIARHDLLILDDFGLQPLDGPARQALLEIIEDRHQHKSTLIASQLPVRDWHAIIGQSAIADAVLDRIAHAAHRIELKGESLRKNKPNSDSPI